MPDARVETFDLDSVNLKDRLRISVALPSGFGDAESLPVILALDPAFTFQTVTAAANGLPLASRIAGGSVPDSAVVGIGYASPDLGEVMARRARDFTPSNGDASPIQLPPSPLGFGGALHFLDAILDEVLPEVGARFGLSIEDRTLFGWSFGGLFALYALLSRPESFRRYLVVSPSIWWDDRVLLQCEQAWADSHTELPAKLFLAVGSEEQTPGGGWKNEGFPDEAIAAVKQVTNFEEFTRRLTERRYQGLDFESVVFDGEYHLTVPAAAVTRGLAWLLNDP